MFTRFMISKAFRGFSRRAIRIFSRSVIGVPCVGIGDGTRCADRLQRVRSLVILRSRAPARCALAPEMDIVGLVAEVRFVPNCRHWVRAFASQASMSDIAAKNR